MTNLRYQEVLQFMSQWAGLGPNLASRLFDGFLSSQRDRANLHELSQFFEKISLCSYCLLPSIDDQECKNCAMGATQQTLYVLMSPLDSFLIKEIASMKDKAFFCLHGYLSSSQGGTLEKIGVFELLRYVKKNGYSQLILLANQSTSTKALQTLLKKTLPETKVSIYHQLRPGMSFLHQIPVHERSVYFQQLYSSQELS